MGFVRSTVAAAIYPLQWSIAVVYRGAVTFPQTVINLGNLARENSELKEKLNSAQPELVRFSELKIENDRLRELLGFQNRGRYKMKLLPAQVIGRGASPAQALLVINRGTGSGVAVDRPVIVAAGLVGKIVEVSRFSSKVMLLTDPLSSVAAADQRSRDFGIAEGRAPDRLRLKYMSANGEVAVGDIIVTSNVSDLFPPGLPVGVVIKAVKNETDLFYEVELKPSADLSKLEEVMIVL